MFVFPAFDENYRVRKRVFKCCSNCRTKKVKCESVKGGIGCKYCLKHGWQCSLRQESGILKPSNGVKEVRSNNIKANKDDGNTNGIKKEPSVTEPVSMDQITPQYLKQIYNFNITGNSDTANEYVFHDHPKAFIANKTADKSVWHESGVYVSSKDSEENAKYRKKTSYHIKSIKLYRYLVSIDAFTLSSSEFDVATFEVKQLLELFFNKVNCIFPIIDLKGFWDDYNDDKAHNIILYAMILAILRDEMAEPILKQVFMRSRGVTSLSKDEFQEDFINFVTDLETKLRQVINILPELGDVNKYTRLVIFLLLSLHFKFDKLGNEQSSHDLTSAINLAFSLGIHMKAAKDTQSIEQAQNSSNLWWCCFVFDRVNAVINSRSIFISQADFNIDLPYSNLNLLKMVQLAGSFENLLYAVYRPYSANVSEEEERENRQKIMNIEEFQLIEFELCERDKANTKIYKENHTWKDYEVNILHFLTRVINNTIIIGAQKSRFDNKSIPNNVGEEIALQASRNILWNLQKFRLKDFLNIPLFPWCVSLAMSCFLKKRAKELLNYSQNENGDSLEWDQLMGYLEVFSTKWWVVEEICNLCNDFIGKLTMKAAKNDEESSRKRIKLDHVDIGTTSDPPHHIPSIRSMLLLPNEYVETESAPAEVLRNPLLESTSPDFANNGVLDENVYQEFFDTMHIDIFDNEYFKDIPAVFSFNE